MRPVEKFAAWYMGGLILLMAVRWRHVLMWPWPMVLTCLMLAAALLMRRARDRTSVFIRDWFPMLLSLYLYKLMAFLSLDLGLRLYYESEPDDAPDGAVGYDEVAVLQETLIGITYTF